MDQIKVSTLNASWRNLWPKIVVAPKKAEKTDERETVVQTIVSTANKIGDEGFSDMQPSEVLEIMVTIVG